MNLILKWWCLHLFIELTLLKDIRCSVFATAHFEIKIGSKYAISVLYIDHLVKRNINEYFAGNLQLLNLDTTVAKKSIYEEKRNEI